MQTYEDSLVAQLETELVVSREAAWHNCYCVLLFIPLLDLTDRQLVLEHNAESRGALFDSWNQVNRKEERNRNV